MFSIAICDDEKLMRNQVVTQIRSNFSYMKSDLILETFEDGEALLDRINEGAYFDMVLLDIEMPGIHGLELAVKLKEIFREIVVIYLSSYEEYVYESFKTQPFRFIPKSKMESMLTVAVKEGIQMVEKDAGKFYIISSNQDIERIPYNDIMYICKDGKNARFVRRSGRISKERKAMREVKSLIKSELFVWADRSFICNISYVRYIDKGYIFLTNGESFPISRERVQSVKDCMLENFESVGRY